eukprot:TRINITY_DN9237_c0_g1_i1.p1 TRINITY_DN9237_c0_g1~~TRINITY_DN9237_c0_g1_i1.p1  ORF type:complete len:257 (-),score=44.32 TRINITY_DN9237_c0_g1_i1:465-1235(-)
MTQTETPQTQPQAYGEEWYWDNRYRQDNGPFDWYQQYSGISPLLNHYIPRDSRVLMVGCGNAVLSEDMVNDGYREIVNIDISSVVIDAMNKKYQDYQQLKYLRMDVRDMSAFENASFDSVIDKGMLDSLMCGPNAQQNARKMLDEVQRVLKPGGVYMLITYGGPHVRLPHLKAPGSWSITLHVVAKPGSRRSLEVPTWKITDPVPISEDGKLGQKFHSEDPDLHYIYVCIKDTERDLQGSVFKEKNLSAISNGSVQ